NNLQMKGVNAAVLMEGVANMARETQDIRVVVVPELNAGTASLIATVINPAIGLGSFLAQLFLRRPLIESATQEFHVDGSWADPQVTRVDGTHHPYKETTP
ncbi:MAG: AsmA-like C-terminal region-containing protein, partial [Rhodoferax sp.]